MIFMYHAHPLNVNPDGPNGNIETLYRTLIGAVSLTFTRSVGMSTTSDGARAFIPANFSKVIAVIKYAGTCKTLVQWACGNRGFVAASVEFFRLGPDAVNFVSMGEKHLNPVNR